MDTSTADQLKEFSEGVSALQNVSALVRGRRGWEYVVVWQVADDRKSVTLAVTDAMKHGWNLKLGPSQMSDICSKLGVVVKLPKFLSILRDAFLKPEKCLTLSVTPGDTLELGLKLLVGEGTTDVSINHTISIIEPYKAEKDGEVFAEFVRGVLLDLQVAKRAEWEASNDREMELRLKVINLEKQVASLSALRPPVQDAVFQQPTGVGSKTKPKSDLVNPNQKRKKGGGMKLGQSQID